MSEGIPRETGSARRRKDIILDTLAQHPHLPTPDIERIIEEKKPPVPKRILRGKDTEKIAEGFLKSYPYFREVKPPEDPNDPQKDFIAYIDRQKVNNELNLMPKINKILVEVKSSLAGVIAAEREYGKDTLLARRRMLEAAVIVLNPRSSQARDEFHQKVMDILQYHNQKM